LVWCRVRRGRVEVQKKRELNPADPVSDKVGEKISSLAHLPHAEGTILV
jgi:hypothetical protein